MHREFATGFRRIRPRRSYKNFGLFCLAHGSAFGNRYPCLACVGSGKGTKEACRQAYRKSVEAYRQEKDEYDRLVRLRREALQRLTKDEIEALRELGL